MAPTSNSTDLDTTQLRSLSEQSPTPVGFELDASLLEVADSASLVNITNDNCGSTCGACTTGVA
ncbi:MULTISPECIES: FxLD family lanthipeptide [Streptomyces]|uniref:FxLD family lantipeptide n=1 Tax=Streptomyces reniochalinae TaxID=2250578 RepID=A0A367F6A0_9ACTN|nr:FxLD family lanthipeptide [Streptomyces reniochalinae]RCG25275.1 FxLD family lantipeptide [Streptomyces reniochalinae]